MSGAAAAAAVVPDSGDDGEEHAATRRGRTPRRGHKKVARGRSARGRSRDPSRERSCDAGAAAAAASSSSSSLSSSGESDGDDVEDWFATHAIPCEYECVETFKSPGTQWNIPAAMPAPEGFAVLEHLHTFMNENDLPGDAILDGVRTYPQMSLGRSTLLWAILKARGDDPLWIPDTIYIHVHQPQSRYEIGRVTHLPELVQDLQVDVTARDAITRWYERVFRWFRPTVIEYTPSNRRILFDRDDCAVRVCIEVFSDATTDRLIAESFGLDSDKLYSDGEHVYMSAEAATVVEKRPFRAHITECFHCTESLLYDALPSLVALAKTDVARPLVIVVTPIHDRGKVLTRGVFTPSRYLAGYDMDVDGYKKVIYHAPGIKRLVFVAFVLITGTKTKAARA